MATNADMIEDSQVHTFNAEIAIIYNQGYKSMSSPGCSGRTLICPSIGRSIE